MPSAPARGPITTRVITELRTLGFPVGDNTAPEDPYGWSGEPNTSAGTFTPWMTSTPLTGSPQRLPGALGDTGTEWSLPYSVYFAGVTRMQTEALADRIREALCNINREEVETDNGNWQIQKISCSSIGGMTRISSAFPDYFAQADTFDVWISKRR